MAMTAVYGNYDGPIADAVENFHGNQLVYVAWDQHLMFPVAAALPLPPQMPFGALVKEVLPSLYAAPFGELVVSNCTGMICVTASQLVTSLTRTLKRSLSWSMKSEPFLSGSRNVGTEYVI